MGWFGLSIFILNNYTMNFNIKASVVGKFCGAIRRYENLMDGQAFEEMAFRTRNFQEIGYHSIFPCFHNWVIRRKCVGRKSNTTNSRSVRKEDYTAACFPNIIGIVLIVVNAGCIPVVELFFLNIRTYFCLDIIRTL